MPPIIKPRPERTQGRAGFRPAESNSPARRGTGPAIGTAVAVGLAVILAGYGFLFSPATELPCQQGPVAYSGFVANSTGVSVAGVVVDLFTRPSYPADAGMTVTDIRGRWSITLNGCPHEADFYWASAADGPLLFSSGNAPLAQASGVRVDVSWQRVNLTWIQEYPNDRTVSIRFTLNGSVLVEAGTNVSGHPATGFLPRTLSGAPGSSALLPHNFTFSQSAPYYVSWVAGTAYRVADVNGSVVTYLALQPEPDFHLIEIREYMSVAAAIETDRANAIYPFKSVAPSGTDTISILYRWAPGNATTNVTALGAKIPLTFDLTEPLAQTVTVTFVNASPYNQCYAWFAYGMEEHWWYYANGTCPLS